MLRQTRGFTLIELLVVIAIIGLLASVILASLSTARGRSKDASTLSELNQLRDLAEFEHLDTNTYDGLQSNQWVTAGVACAGLSLTGNYAAKARDICTKIVADAGITGSVFYAGVNFNLFGGQNAAYQKYYSFMAYLPGATADAGGVAQYACVGASGGTYKGPIDPGGGNWTGTGCYANP